MFYPVVLYLSYNQNIMKLFANVSFDFGGFLFVPYLGEHVPVYHRWMKSEFLQAMTASEPLSLEEEYAMQKTWMEDDDSRK